MRTRGQATLEDMRGFGRALIALPGFRPGVFALIDHRDVDFSSFTASDARVRVEDALMLNTELGDARLGVVVGSMADYGIHRMMELIAGDRYTFRTRVFTDLDEAHAWLEQERAR